MALVSIIIPVYNVEPYLEKCLDSVVSQTFKDIEIILIDNGGNDDGRMDGCPEICRRYAKADSRIKLVRLEQNIGLRGAVFKGLEETTSKYVTFADSDDWLEKDCVDTLYKAIIKSGVDCVSSGHIEHYGNDQKVFFKKYNKIFEKEEIEKELLQLFYEKTGSLWDEFGNHRWGKLYKTDFLKQASTQCDMRISMAEDLEINLIFLSICERVQVIGDYAGYYYRMDRNDSISNKFNPERLTQNDIFTQQLERLAKKQGREGRAIRYRHALFSFHEISLCVNNDTDQEQKKEFINRAIDGVSQDMMIEHSLQPNSIFLGSNLSEHEKIYFSNKVLDIVEKSDKIEKDKKDKIFIQHIFLFLQSGLSKKNKARQIRHIKQKIKGKKNIISFSNNQSINARISCWLLYIGLESVLINLYRFYSLLKKS